jgi:hypothetical protein
MIVYKTIMDDLKPPTYLSDDLKPSTYLSDDAKPSTYLPDDAKPSTYLSDNANPSTYLTDDTKKLNSLLTRLSEVYDVNPVGLTEAFQNCKADIERFICLCDNPKNNTIDAEQGFTLCKEIFQLCPECPGLEHNIKRYEMDLKKMSNPRLKEIFDELDVVLHIWNINERDVRYVYTKIVDDLSFFLGLARNSKFYSTISVSKADALLSEFLSLCPESSWLPDKVNKIKQYL